MAQAGNDVTPLKQRILRDSVPLGTGAPVYQIRMTQSPQTSSCPFRVYDCGKPSVGIKHFEKVILLVGSSGAGKTTLINLLVNYVFGVEFEDAFRLQLVVEDSHKDQAHSQTQHVTAYTIHHQEGFKVPYTLTIIDTPGFGSTEGLDRDKQIAKQLQDFFKSDANVVDHIDVVGFVLPATLTRLSPSEVYVFNSILALFGNDISENIFLLLTFTDSQQPVVLPTIQAANIPYNTFLKFNNPPSLIFGGNADVEGKKFNRKCWNIGMKSFQCLNSTMEGIPTKSLSLTKDVLEHRHIIEVYLDVMNRQVRESLTKLQRLIQEESLLEKYSSDMERNRLHTFDVEEPVDISERILSILPSVLWRGLVYFVTWYTELPFPLPPIDSPGPSTVTRTITLADMKARYEEAEGKAMSLEQVVETIREELETLQDQIVFAVCEVRESQNKLQRIALRGSSLTILEYIDILIQNEKAQVTPSGDERLGKLESIREWAKRWTSIAADGFDPFAEFSDIIKLAAKESNGKPFERGSPQYSEYRRARKAFKDKIGDDFPDFATHH